MGDIFLEHKWTPEKFERKIYGRIVEANYILMGEQCIIINVEPDIFLHLQEEFSPSIIYKAKEGKFSIKYMFKKDECWIETSLEVDEDEGSISENIFT